MVVMKKDILVVCRGGGDLATGIAHRLHRAGFTTVILETDNPTSIRRQVCFSEAVYDKECTVEDVRAVKADTVEEIDSIICEGDIPVLIDSNGDSIKKLSPNIVVDAIIAKRNIGTCIDMADVVIGVGPGFVAGDDVHYVVETQRGHNLGRIYTSGSAAANTGIPGNIGGYTSERVIHAEADGYMHNFASIGDVVSEGQDIAGIYDNAEFAGDYVAVKATISGVLRGLIRDGYKTTCGLKIADIDPRIEELNNCFTISDKSRAIAGSVLEIVSSYARKQ